MRSRIALVTTAALAVAGLGGVAVAAKSSEPSASSERPRSVVQVTLDEWRLDAGRGPVRAGPVTFEERNVGGIEHDLMVVRTSRPANDLPSGLEGVAPELAGTVVLGELHRDHHGRRSSRDQEHGSEHGTASTHLRPDARRRRTVNLAPGNYVLLCPLPGHYERGQRTVISVSG